MNGWQQVLCPHCGGFLLNFAGISAQFVMQMPCACGQWVGIKQGLLAVVIDPPTLPVVVESADRSAA